MNWIKSYCMPELKIVIAVQGEGRGHLTQAIAISRILISQGHTVAGIIAGKNPNRPLPEFFYKSMPFTFLEVESPHFIMNSKGNAIHMPSTVFRNLMRARTYLNSLRKMRTFLETHRPDVVVNLYEPLVALYTLSYFRSFEIISIAHQYIYLHPEFRFPKGFRLQSSFLKYYTRFTAIGSRKIMALSMYDLPVCANTKLKITPPALREVLFNKSVADEGFLLVYVLNSHFMAEIMQWHRRHPEVKLVCFTDNRDVKDRYKGTFRIDDHLVFHSLHQEKFLDLMARCSGLVSTAGFESVCEAIYLGKPVMLIPVDGHFEQFCNAIDSARIGAGTYSTHFDFDPAMVGQLQQSMPTAKYREWVHRFPQALGQAIAELHTVAWWKYESIKA